VEPALNLTMPATMAGFFERAARAYQRRRRPERVERYQRRAAGWRWRVALERCAS
jgi:hypothetical protein